MSNKVQPYDEVSIVYFVENGVQCWSLDLDDVDMCERRGYPYTVVKYTRKEAQDGRVPC
jgi:hypothetical protein